MRRRRPCIVVAFWALSLIALAGCHQVTGVSPNPVEAGASITIAGSAFGASQGSGKVLFDGIALSVIDWGDKQIQAQLPGAKAPGTYALAVVIHGESKSTSLVIAPPPAPRFTVNVPSDGSDASPGDGVCEMTASGADCSLRAAIEEANGAPSGREVTVVLPPTGGPYGLHLGWMVVTATVRVEGGSLADPAVLVNDGPTALLGDTVFRVEAGGFLTFRGIALENMRFSAALEPLGAIMASPGGRLRGEQFRTINTTDGGPAFAAVGGVMELVDCRIENARPAVYTPVLLSRDGGELSLERCLLNGVSGEEAEIVRVDANSTFTMTDSTLTGSSTRVSATNSDQLIVVNGSAMVASSTITRNHIFNAAEGPLFTGSSGRDSVFDIGASGSLTLAGSIVADQDTSDPTMIIDTLCAGAIANVSSGGYNHVDDTSCGLAGTGDVQSGSAGLGPLDFSLGDTGVHVPDVSSPVLDAIPAGTLGLCEPGEVDQRGVARPRGAGCDKGAAERIDS